MGAATCNISTFRRRKQQAVDDHPAQLRAIDTLALQIRTLHLFTSSVKAAMQARAPHGLPCRVTGMRAGSC